MSNLSNKNLIALLGPMRLFSLWVLTVMALSSFIRPMPALMVIPVDSRTVGIIAFGVSDARVCRVHNPHLSPIDKCAHGHHP